MRAVVQTEFSRTMKRSSQFRHGERRAVFAGEQCVGRVGKFAGEFFFSIGKRERRAKLQRRLRKIHAVDFQVFDHAAGGFRRQVVSLRAFGQFTGRHGAANLMRDVA